MTREAFDKKQEKLERMEKIVRDAIRLKDAIKSEVDAIMEEIDAEINSPRKAKPVFWDGKQPHYWRENGKMFRRAMKYDIGRTVIVCNWHDPNPLNNLENKALLEGITQFDDFAVRSTNGSRLCHFPLAWVDCHPSDTSFDDVPHICVFMGNTLAKVENKPEQADPLIDEKSFLKSEAAPQSGHIADANKMAQPAIPAGWRELEEGEVICSGDKLVYPGGKVKEMHSEMIGQRHERPNRAHCRVIRRKIEQPAEAREPQYREPTQADLANGPIDVEVCDDTNCDLNWEKRQLYAILPSKCTFPYIVGCPGVEELTQSWKHSRIKVEV